MRTVWATVLSVWALCGVIAFLAWTRPQPASTPSQSSIPSAVIVKNKNGTSRLVVVSGTGTAATHATTRTSPPPAG